MKKFALGLATVATFAVMSIGAASPAMADLLGARQQRRHRRSV